MMAFKAVTERLRGPEDYELITYRLMQKLAGQNVVHVEVYVSVGVVHWRGQDFAPIFEGMERGRSRGERDFGVSLLWIFDAVRHFGVEAAEKVFDLAAQLQHRNVVGIGIGGIEQQGPAENFRGPGIAFDGSRRRDRGAGIRVGGVEHWRGADRAWPLCARRS
jgi:adenosine deaminase/aminodeoxyfutalosine deaminase